MRSRVRRFVAALLIIASVLHAPAPASAASANEDWLRHAYSELLGRVADSGGLDYWIGGLAADGDESRTAVAMRMAFSPEGARKEVDRAYGDLLGRAAEAGGRTFWTGYLQENPATLLRAQLLGSDERVGQAGGDLAAWIDGVYLEILGRNVDPVGRAHWVGQVEAGRDRVNVVLDIYRSEEGLTRRTNNIHLETLGRPATTAERASGRWIIVNEGERALRARLIASDEAYEVFVAVGALRAGLLAGIGAVEG